MPHAAAPGRPTTPYRQGPQPMSTAAALADDVRAFRNYLTAERGHSPNTVLAYGRDLDRYTAWVAGGGLADYLKPTVRDLSHYVSHLHDEQLAPPSIARHL